MVDFSAEVTGRRIRELRRDMGMSQRVLAERAGVKQNTVAQYEKGTARPSLEVLVKLAEIFQTTTDYLLGLTD